MAKKQPSAKASGATSHKSPSGPRKLKKPTYASFKLQRRIKHTGPAVPGAFRLLKDAFVALGKNWKVFIGIVAIYAILNAVFAQGLAVLQTLDQTKSSLATNGISQSNALLFGTTLFISLAGFANTDPAAAIYQFVLTLMASLVLIWTLRQVFAGAKVRVRDGFYRGMFPLVPFVLVLCVMGLQLLPLIAGLAMYSLVATTGIASTGVELIMWAVIAFILALLSLYMMTSSVFALYIVCLPDMTPLQALRSARKLVHGRRWMVLRKMIFLPFVIIAGALIILLPLLIYATAVAGWIYFVYSMFGLAVVHAYMYRLYRALL